MSSELQVFARSVVKLTMLIFISCNLLYTTLRQIAFDQRQLLCTIKYDQVTKLFIQLGIRTCVRTIDQRMFHKYCICIEAFNSRQSGVFTGLVIGKLLVSFILEPQRN